tara:strand:- start:168 stop:368 length:201 start_codon:yes stop_codon:yes gene_type:complete
MKILRIPTYWRPEEASCVYQFLDELKTAVWQSYGDDITAMHKAIWEEEQQRKKDDKGNDNYELPFF